MDNAENQPTYGTQDEDKQENNTLCVGHHYPQVLYRAISICKIIWKNFTHVKTLCKLWIPRIISILI
jgi:hypothetical protein